MRIGLNSPQAFLSLLLRRRWWIIAPFVVLTCLVLVLTSSLPKTYVSTTLILVQPRDVPTEFVVDLTAGSVEDRLKTIEQTVLSRTNLLAIIREFGDQLPELRELNMDEKVEKLNRQIGVAFQGGENLVSIGAKKTITYFQISYQNQTPKLAQKIAAKLTDLFIEQDNKNREGKILGTRDFFSKELNKVAEELRASAARLKQLKAGRQNELPERLETNLRRLDSLGQDTRTNEEAIGRNVTLRLNTEQLLAETPPTIVRQPPAAPRTAAATTAPAAPAEDPKIVRYRAAKLAYDQLVAAGKLPGNPDVLRAKAPMDSARAQLSPVELAIAENPPAPSAPAPSAVPEIAGVPAGTEPNPRYQSLVGSLRDAETEYQILQSQKAEIQKQIALYRSRVEGTPQIELELADVLRENSDLQKQYDELKGKLSQAELSASLDSEQKAGQFQIVDQANLPVTPTKPKKGAVALGGTAASFLMALVFAVVVDTARQRIWTHSEIESFWGVPVLVDVPEILTDMDLAATRRKKWIFAASAVGAAMVFSVCLYGVHLKHDYILRQLDPVLQKIIYK